MPDRTCSVDACDRLVGRHGARGMCSMHYKRWKATGSTELRERLTPLERLRASVRVDPNTGCWNWTGAKAGQEYRTEGRGYSAFYFEGRLTSGHRASYIIANGPIPDELEIDHLCRNTLCVNPEHLEAVTPRENVRRAASVITHCPQGHPYDEANTYVSARGGRQCRKCRTAAVQRAKARRQ